MGIGGGSSVTVVLSSVGPPPTLIVTQLIVTQPLARATIDITSSTAFPPSTSV
jgi:hypothetical protein